MFRHLLAGVRRLRQCHPGKADAQLRVGRRQHGTGFRPYRAHHGLCRGHISGGHFNPAVSVGLFIGGRFEGKELLPYIFAQVIGAILAAAVLYFVATGKAEFDIAASGLASNGYGEHSPGGYSIAAALTIEIVLTAFFLIIIMGSTDARAPKGFAPIAIGLALTLIHLISIPVTNTSVNPARSTGVALFQGGGALGQLWLFWLAPLIGGAIGAGIYRCLLSGDNK